MSEFAHDGTNQIKGFVHDGMKMETLLAAYNPCENDPHGATSMPIYQTATFAQPGATDFGEYDYTRSGNPTRTALQKELAILEGVEGAQSFCFSTGMAALSAVTRLAKAGDEVIVNDDSYGGTYRLMSKVATGHGIVVRYVNLSGTEGVDNLRSAINEHTRLVMIESPTNPIQRVCDIRGLAKVCQEQARHTLGTLLAIDNTMMSPVLCRPLQLGADIVIHSATKFIAGHSDTMAGVVTTKPGVAVGEKSLAETVYFYQNAEGTALAPFDCWNVLKGLKTMALRVKEQQRNAIRIASWLESHPLVTTVFHASLASHLDRDLHFSQASGPGSVVCFLTGNTPLSEHVVTVTKLFKITVSFGSVSSLISIPGKMSHASIPEEVRQSRAFPEDLVRLSIGIEDIDDLIDDLKAAFSSFFDVPSSSS
eukprot:gene1892-2070_t